MLSVTKSGRMKLFPHNFGEPHNRTANPPGLNQHAMLLMSVVRIKVQVTQLKVHS